MQIDCHWNKLGSVDVIKKSFEIQPVNKTNRPEGDQLLISVPTETPINEFLKLQQAFIDASKLPFPKNILNGNKNSSWASNLVSGIGLGT
jgi:hypothetical protein